MEVYLDNSATTKVHDEVIDAVVNTMKVCYGNPSSLHSKGVEAEKLVKISREQIANKLKVPIHDVYFTSSGTESNNLAIIGSCMANRIKGELITSKIEHKSTLECFKYLESIGYTVHYLDAFENGIVDLDKLSELVNENTQLVSIMYVNNECGSIQPISEINTIIKRKNPKTLFHTDAVQAFCKVDIPKKCADLITVSAHKIHAPKGVSALYIKKGTKIKPIIYGGGQEKAIRSGTENTPAIVGFGLACDIATIEQDLKYVANLKEIMQNRIINEIENVYVNSPQQSSPYILNISIIGVRSEILLHSLEQKGIYVSSGSACSSRKQSPSHVLTAMGFKKERVDSSIRISFSKYNTESEVQYACDTLAQVAKDIRKVINK